MLFFFWKIVLLPHAGFLLPMLMVNNLSFERNAQLLFSNLSFSLHPGKVLQISGPNGCGKTSLLRLLCGLDKPSAGEIAWDGCSIHEDRANYLRYLLYVGHRVGIKSGLTVLENLKLAAVLAGVQLTDLLYEVLAKIGLSDYQNVLVAALSAGQQRRLAIAKLLLNTKVRLWILDEPFTALDSSGINLVEALIAEHVTTGGMVVMTSHQLFQLSNIQQEQLIF